mgnify:CR=1 FL=1
MKNLFIYAFLFVIIAFNAYSQTLMEQRKASEYEMRLKKATEICNSPDAIKYFDFLINDIDQSAISKYCMGSFYYSEKLYQKAIANYYEAKTFEAEFYETYRGLGDSSVKLKDFDSALSYYGADDVVKDKEDDEYWALKILDKIIGSNDYASYTLEKRKKIMDEKFYVLYQIADIYRLGKGASDSAATYYIKILDEIDRSLYSEPEQKEKFAPVYNNLGISLSNQNFVGYGGQLYEQALGLSSDNATYNHYTGMYYYNKGEYDKALPYLNKAIFLDRDYFSSYDVRGSLYFERGLYDLAIDDFTSAINIGGDNNDYNGDNNTDVARMYKLRSDCYIPKGVDESDSDKAKEYLDNAVADLLKAAELDKTNNDYKDLCNSAVTIRCEKLYNNGNARVYDEGEVYGRDSDELCKNPCPKSK